MFEFLTLILVSGSKLDESVLLEDHFSKFLSIKYYKGKTVKKTATFTEQRFSVKSILFSHCNLKKKNCRDLKTLPNSYRSN